MGAVNDSKFSPPKGFYNEVDDAVFFTSGSPWGEKLTSE